LITALRYGIERGLIVFGKIRSDPGCRGGGWARGFDELVQRLDFVIRKHHGNGPCCRSVPVPGFAFAPLLNAYPPEAVLLPCR
jgi:hypothetical protein